jgi:nicotinamide-nucleotide amidase
MTGAALPAQRGTEIAAPVATLVDALAGALRARGACIATAESCTGGLIAGACTDLAGSSDWFDRGFVTYSNAAKTDLLGVDAGLIAAQGAVSEPVARAMAAGALARSPAALTVAVTGVAGPGGGSLAKPVGLVWLAWAWRDAAGAVQTDALQQHFGGDRAAVRQATVLAALQGLLARAQAHAPVQGRPMSEAAP